MNSRHGILTLTLGCALLSQHLRCGGESIPVTRPAESPILDAAQISVLPPDRAYDETLRLLADSRQSEAERAARALVLKHPKHARIQFLHAVLVRSRFDVQGASVVFKSIMEANKGTVEAQAAEKMLRIDERQEIVNNFSVLSKLARERERDDPLMIWLAAIACRTLHRNIEGIQFYRTLEGHWPNGPVLMHQTYANLLHDEERFEEALKEREEAVRLEKTGWTYQGLAIEYAGVNNRTKAEEAFERAAELQPNYLLTWWTWANCLRDWGDYEKSIEKCERALEIDPNCAQALNIWGMALGKLNQEDKAIDKFQAAIKADPKSPYPYLNLADVMEKRGDTARAEEYRKLAKRVKAGLR